MEATADDGSVTTTDTSATLTVLNTPPSAFNPLIIPQSLKQDWTILNAALNMMPWIRWRQLSIFSWEADGQPTNHTTDTVPGADTNTDEEWVCTVTPYDGTDDGAPVSVFVVIDLNTEGTQGYTFCASGGTVSNNDYDMTFCLSPVGVGV